jgi:hypothetical protein
MKKVPIERQVVPVDHLQAAEWLLQLGELPSSEQLASAVKCSGDRPLPPRLREHLVLVLTGKIKARTGRKPISPAKLTFLMREVDVWYEKFHAKFVSERRKQRTSGHSTRQSASELAYTAVLKRLKRDLPNRDWMALKNMHSKWRQGKLVKLHEHPEDGEVI